MLPAEAQHFCLQAVITCDSLKTVTLKELPLTGHKREATAFLSDSTGNGGIMGKGISWKTCSGFDERQRHKVATDSGLPHASYCPTGTGCGCSHSAAVGPVLMQGVSPDVLF